jgi:hypothetical protein
MLRLTEPRSGARVYDPQQGWQGNGRVEYAVRVDGSALLRLTEPRSGQRVCDPQQALAEHDVLGGINDLQAFQACRRSPRGSDVRASSIRNLSLSEELCEGMLESPPRFH